jgi:hypothetical protein
VVVRPLFAGGCGRLRLLRKKKATTTIRKTIMAAGERFFMVGTHLIIGKRIGARRRLRLDVRTPIL